MISAVVATIPDVDSSHEDLRRAYNDILNTNSTSVAVLTTAFTPLPRGERFFRSRFHERTDDGEFATNCLGGVLGISKLGTNVLKLKIGEQEEQVLESEGSRISYQAVNPRHYRTALNEFRGRLDLFEGVKVVEELAMCER
ncbi:hypothetical protein HBI04_194020 [Parastagonospora nodorum]|nr:hypothetical protein HBI03_201660 [Parastagonospora nodorum]KAH4263398.1 hypothetical protein HBI04_194020 [Parastagonospora nodorum]KAH5337525.1 hypothetical protein HBI50_023150 [Parastagonospora nodorum]KAH5397863.1 hypothetical protein HBI32_192900 [Parastagonospora nodorum]KAH5461262.1 hypothetical protein HBI30_015860 [Parastagonospora nodorum]